MEPSSDSTPCNSRATCESGWSSYLDNFSLDNHSLIISHSSSSSSSVRNNLFDSDHVLEYKCGRRRRRKPHVDEEFEDTATSPISSPKSGDSELSGMNTMEKEKKSFFEDKERQVWEMEEGGKGCSYGGGGEERCSELKKRGLCLVPIAVVQNYISSS